MQYPHNILITKKPVFEQDENHNFKPVDEGVEFPFECRAEPADNNPVIKGADGNDVVCSWIVYMPKTIEVFEFGDKVKITIDEVEYENTLKRQSNGQLNTRLWV